jgi:hypothetical protein
VLGLEVGRRQRALRADPREHALGHRSVLGEDLGVKPRPLAPPADTEPGDVARRDERQRLVGRLEDLTTLVERVAPGGLVAGDAGVQHEVMVAAGHRDRVELDGPERANHRERPVGAARDGPRRSEEVARHEEATRRLSGDLHLQETSPASVRPPHEPRTPRPTRWPVVATVPRARRGASLTGLGPVHTV